MSRYSFSELSVTGSNYEIGFQIGQYFRENIENTLKTINFTKIRAESEKLKPWFQFLWHEAQQEMPEYINELKGIADGAQIDFETLLFYNFLHAIDFELCSTVIIKHQKEIVLGHNEDYDLELGKESYLLRVNLNDGTKFFAFTYPGTLPGSAFAINSHGLIFSANSLPIFNRKSAFPRIFVDRKILEMKSIDDIISLLNRYNVRSAALNYNIISVKEFRAVNIETTYNDIAVREITDAFFHSNHFISPKFSHIPLPKFSKSTLQRLKAARKYIQSRHKQEIRVKEILFHPEIHDTKSPNPTLCTVVFRIKKNNIHFQLFGKNTSKPILNTSFTNFVDS